MDLRLAHIYAQSYHHGEAVIVANKSALLAIKEAIEKSLENGSEYVELFPKDGEGYDLHIICDDSDWQGESWQNRPLPYTDPF